MKWKALATKQEVNELKGCIAEGHKMDFVNYQIHYNNYDYEFAPRMNFKCQRCGFVDYRLATDEEKTAIKTIKNASYKND
jgi:hypothetical protein